MAVVPQAVDLDVQFVSRYENCGDVYSVALQGRNIVLGCYQFMDIVSVVDPTNLVRVKGQGFPGSGGAAVLDVAVSGHYAYIANASQSGELVIMDISDPAHSVQVGVYKMAATIQAIAISGNYAYLAAAATGMHVINISNPAVPSYVTSYDTPGSAYGIAVSGNYAYVADNANGLRVLDISTPAVPVEVDDYNTPGYASGVVVVGNYAYVADGYTGLRMIDVSNPAAIYEIGYYDTPGTAQDVFVSGKYAYVADNQAGLRVIDVSIPDSPLEAGYYDTQGGARDVVVSGDYVYIADIDSLVVVRAVEPTPTPTRTITATPTKAPTATPTPGPLHLPLVLRNYTPCFKGSWEVEPNNSYQDANGPLCFGQDYYGYPDDARDYFSFYLPAPGDLTITLDDYTAHGVQMLLYDQIPVVNGEVRRDYEPPYQIDYSGAAGWYSLYIYASGNYNNNPYTLRIEAP